MQNHRSFTEQKHHHCLAAIINNDTLIYTQASIHADRKFVNCEFTIIFFEGDDVLLVQGYIEKLRIWMIWKWNLFITIMKGNEIRGEDRAEKNG